MKSARLRPSTTSRFLVFNAAGQIESVRDAQLATPSNPDGSIVYSYDALGRKVEMRRPNGTRSTYKYDTLTGWTSQIAHLSGANANHLTLNYTRDNTGIIRAISEIRGAEQFRWDYGHDGLKRLTTAVETRLADSATVQSYAYAYDRNGNRKSEATLAATTTYTYNKLDQMLTSSKPGETHAYAWDQMGRMKSDTNGAVQRTFEWSVDDRMLSVAERTSGAVDYSIAYTYDHLGTRTSRNAPGEPDPLTRYLGDYENPTGYSQILADVSADALATRENSIYGDGFGPLAQAHNPGASGFDVRHLLGDHLSTTRGLTANNGSYTPFTYTPFGSPTAGDGSLTNYAFTGQWKEGRTGLQWHRARWTSKSLSRWLSQDEVFDWPENFANPFLHAGASAMGQVDPSGLFTLAEASIASGVASTLHNIQFSIGEGLLDIAMEVLFATFIIATIVAIIASLAYVVAVAFLGDLVVKIALAVMVALLKSLTRTIANTLRTVVSTAGGAVTVALHLKRMFRAPARFAREGAAFTKLLYAEARNTGILRGTKHGGAHFLTRHGAHVPDSALRQRCIDGTLPDMPSVKKPIKKNGKLVGPDSSKFLSYEDEAEAVEGLYKEYAKQPRGKVEFDLGRSSIGHGYKSDRPWNTVPSTGKVTGYFDENTGILVTCFPQL